MTEAEIVVLGFALQALGGVVLSAAFLVYAHLYRRRILAVWGGAWLALTVSLLGTALSYWAFALAELPVAEVRRTLASVLSTGGRMGHIALLGVGAWELGRERTLPNRRVAALLVGAVLLGTLVVFLTAGSTPSLRVVLRLYIPQGLTTVASLAAAWAVVRSRPPVQVPGAGIFAASLVVWALFQPTIMFLEGAVSPVLYQMMALFLVAIGAVIWFLEDERERGRSQEGRLKTVFEVFPLAVTISRLSDGHFLEANEATARVLGYTREELLGRSANELGIWPDPEERDAIVRALARREGVRNVAVKLRRKDGQVRSFLVTAEVTELQGEPCIMTLTRDRTDALLLEERLRQAERMESVGRLAGGVAHDFNNILTVIGGQAELVAQAEGATEDIREMAGEISAAHERGKELVRSLLQFARREYREYRPLELRALVRELDPLLRRLVSAGRVFEVDVRDAVRVVGDRSQLEQVMMNLVVNASQATDARGRITLRVFRRRVSAPIRYQVGEVSPGDWTVLEVSDDGTGMDAETLTHIFEPFYTTKGVGEGTGLGLATVYGIVEQHQGVIGVESRRGEGTTFRVYLPSADEEQG